MPTTIITGATGSGKTTALRQRYNEWVQAGLRTDQILVLTSGALATAQWRQRIDLPAHGPVEAHSFQGFIQRELNLYWALVQAAVPALRPWVRPTYLDAAVAQQLMQGQVEPMTLLFGESIKATSRRIAAQIASNILPMGAASGLSPGEVAGRLAAAGSPDKAPVYQSIQGLLEGYRDRCLAAGLLDYGLALQLFTQVLLHHPFYLDHLRGRFRRLLVDDLDEAVEAEQAFLEAVAGQMEEAVFAVNPDGGLTSFRGADAAQASARFERGATVVALSGSFSCSPAMLTFGEALAERIFERQPSGPVPHMIEAWSITDLRGELVEKVVASVRGLLDRGVSPGQIAVLMPYPEKALEVALRQKGPRQVGIQSLAPAHRLVDEPVIRAIIVLAGLVSPHWRIPGWSAGWVAAGLQVLLDLDPIRASLLGEAVFQASGDLPAPANPASANSDLANPAGDSATVNATPTVSSSLRSRIGDRRARSYDRLHTWVTQAREREWQTDQFVQAAILEMLAPLRRGATEASPSRAGSGAASAGTSSTGTRPTGDGSSGTAFNLIGLTPDEIRTCQQYLSTVHRFREAAERLGEGAFGHEYIPLLTEAFQPLESWMTFDPAKDAVLLATPFGYLNRRLTSQYQIWVDISSPGWYASDVQELANPHVLSPRWHEGDRWTDRQAQESRRANAARITRALVRRCTGRLILAECALSPWGQEQEGGLADAFADLEGRARS